MPQWMCALGSEFWAGLIGVLFGGLITILGQWLTHRWQTSAGRSLDEKRKKHLKSMLDNPGPTGWRKMETLSSVIGADRETTARLLIEMDARGSETGKDIWAYIKDKPLPTSD